MCPSLRMSRGSGACKTFPGILERACMQSGPSAMSPGPFPLCRTGFNHRATLDNARRILSDGAPAPLAGQKQRVFAF